MASFIFKKLLALPAPPARAVPGGCPEGGCPEGGCPQQHPRTPGPCTSLAPLSRERLQQGDASRRALGAQGTHGSSSGGSRHPRPFLVRSQGTPSPSSGGSRHPRLFLGGLKAPTPLPRGAHSTHGPSSGGSRHPRLLLTTPAREAVGFSPPSGPPRLPPQGAGISVLLRALPLFPARSSAEAAKLSE